MLDTCSALEVGMVAMWSTKETLFVAFSCMEMDSALIREDPTVTSVKLSHLSQVSIALFMV